MTISACVRNSTKIEHPFLTENEARYGTNTREAGAEVLAQIPGHFGLHSETLSHKPIKTKIKQALRELGIKEPFSAG